MAAANGSRAHREVLAFPFPSQGHILPMLDLIRHLIASRSITVTVVVTPKNLPILSSLLDDASPAVRPLVLPFPRDAAADPSFPAGVENLNGLSHLHFYRMYNLLSSLHNPILNWTLSGAEGRRPSAIISDMFLGWTNRLAAELGIPRIVFSPSGALAISLIDSLWRTMPEVPGGDVGDGFCFPSVPGSPVFPWREISSNYRRYMIGDPASEKVREGFLANMASWGYVINTFDALEGRYLEHLKRDLGHRRVWAVGPLCRPTAAARGGTSSAVPEAEVMGWLDRCPDNSVVYVCFGSQASQTAEQAAALAAGLELSGARFVWAARAAAASAAADEGFERRVEGRGMVIRGWAPQVAILGHRAVGSFLTHCGWNSVMEGIAAGVPLLTWPMEADQFANARLLEEEEMGVRAGDGGWAESVDRLQDPERIARVVAKSVDEAGRRMTARAAEMRKKAAEAVEEGVGGTSFADLDGFVEALTLLP